MRGCERWAMAYISTTAFAALRRDLAAWPRRERESCDKEGWLLRQAHELWGTRVRIRGWAGGWGMVGLAPFVCVLQACLRRLCPCRARITDWEG